LRLVADGRRTPRQRGEHVSRQAARAHDRSARRAHAWGRAPTRSDGAFRRG
jgi:hypothetical protein